MSMKVTGNCTEVYVPSGFSLVSIVAEWGVDLIDSDEGEFMGTRAAWIYSHRRK
jgi:hypothetical protein